MYLNLNLLWPRNWIHKLSGVWTKPTNKAYIHKYMTLHFLFKRKPAVFTLVYFLIWLLVIRNSKENQELLELKWKHNLLTYRNDINLLDENTNVIKNVDLYWMLSRMRNFPHPSRPTLGRNQPSVQREVVRFPGGKADGAWRWPGSREGVRGRW